MPGYGAPFLLSASPVLGTDRLFDPALCSSSIFGRFSLFLSLYYRTLHSVISPIFRVICPIFGVISPIYL